ncbi:oligopeptide/dipeptide ABC transporter ATP-binding protein [Bordetella hinzii]|uniref:Oligopeptide/dipeptide transporter, C-terminal domain protein n=1 Tax=Bordetella hinzii OH87 BAL007II TaxID=1331262 RepID=A0ABR4QZ07_9BORD|nr:ABC transporter ATP-binding protein [Bordetella hinzii]AKQ54777.1 Oligopeptide transport ATP-binding protein OppF [Bordetella hinzii]KCB23436.1 oligopeptide/dipeptide transporter, C-terminal domain protein [Bordetella hinzii OH87 BAL007II]KCB30217.1 oligopeptide/dipeptide transporter, C-terminal domain protein [Bordetella hinzii CA90 BAL1384]KCB31120.1 oligopeptide/dipeptide transporter, C-terminal domain protein [Bordetella hinzii L60]KCB39564.1 oligopeptide/dipeptide transporter, C-termin
MTDSLLELRDLHLRYRTRRGPLSAVDGVSLTVGAGETVALIGESGCGKTSLGKAVVRLNNVSQGEIRFKGQDLARLQGRALRPYRADIQMIFQDTLAALDPRHKAAHSVEMPLRVQGVPSAERRRRVEALFGQVGLSWALRDRLPHQLSGGQRQRLNIARALATRPALVVCDEPVSALDVTLQTQILDLLHGLQQSLGVAYLFISHDLSVVSAVADRVAVMYLGRIVEILPGAQLGRLAAHPYTRLLLESIPGQTPAHRKLAGLAADAVELPSPYALPPGCRFQSRCPRAAALCRQVEPALAPAAPGQAVACHYPIHFQPESASWPLSRSAS